MLAAAISAQATACSFLYGIPFLIPLLQEREHLTLAQASLLAVTPVIGVLLALVGWGAAADRYGERIVLITGLVSTAAALLIGLSMDTLLARSIWFVVAGACGASTNAASGRMVIGWFDAHERGLAMGIRQTSTPLGVGIASLCLPPLGNHLGFCGALVLPALLCLLAAVFVRVVVVDPPRPVRGSADDTGSPYRTPTLWRVHAASALLVGPQFFAATFALTYLVSRQHFDPVGAGQLVALAQVGGAAGRIGAGVWSDRVGSRLRPMRQIAVLAIVCMLVWALGDLISPWLAITALMVSLIVTVTDNGLAFTATAEMAGPFWAGRAFGVQNTGQNMVAMLTPPIFASLITAAGYPLALSAVAILPAVAVLVTPVHGESVRRDADARGGVKT
jgi:sugar phosphate permease